MHDLVAPTPAYKPPKKPTSCSLESNRVVDQAEATTGGSIHSRAT